jgi:hypothetical protein
MAHIYVLVGRQDAAIEELEHLASLQSLWFSPTLLRIDPRWDPLRKHPRFQELLQKYGGDEKQQ